MENLFEIKKNQAKMIQDRGFDIRDEVALLDPNFPLINFKIHYTNLAAGESVRRVLSNRYINSEEKMIIVYYADPGNKDLLPVEVVRSFIEEINKFGKKVESAILITNVKLSSNSEKEIKDIVLFHIQVFNDEELMFNPTEHVLVPKHEALTQEEIREFLKNNNVKIFNIPLLRKNDPIVKYYGWLPGQIIRIYRESNFLDQLITRNITYRVVHHF